MFELITNADIYAPQPMGVNHLLICAGKIIHISKSEITLDDNIDVRVTDLDGARLLPGFIDAHSHITGGGGEAGPSTLVPPLSLSQFTRAGITTVVGLLGTDDFTRSTQGLLTHVAGLREQGLSARCYTGGYHLPAATLTESVKGDIVNLDPVIGVGELAISDHRSSQPSQHEILRLASETHVAGLMTGKAGIVHFHLGDGERGLSLINSCLDQSEIPARVFNPTHINRNKPLFDQACDLSARGCSVDITAFPSGIDDRGWDTEQAVHRFIDKGCDIDFLTISSDGGGCLPKFNEKGELERMGFATSAALPIALKELLKSGLSLSTVLPLMTSNVARLLKFHQKGRIAKGLDADLLVLDEDDNVRSVMAMGRWHMCNGESVIKGMFEE